MSNTYTQTLLPMNGASLKKDADRKIAILLGLQGGGGGSGSGEGDSQQDGDKNDPGQAGQPKTGDTWETASGVIVCIVVLEDGTIESDDGNSSWSKDLKSVSGTYGDLIRKVGGSTVQSEPETDHEVEEIERKPGEFSSGTKGDPRAKGKIKRSVLLTEGCYAELRNGDKLGPFNRTTKSTDEEWPFMVNTSDGPEVYRCDGTYHLVEGTESPKDAVKLISKAEADA